jgi:hypothetical protein
MGAIRKSGSITKKEAVALIGHHYYCNAPFHVGNVLSRMVNAGMIRHIKNGLFTSPSKGKQGTLL